ncbi:MAG TPA: hypothetical protein VFV75_01945 [Candidatus Polarisedimenticolaceae bacterium]|nr:hypothetical protein [Candidatus Polarisedimenticolaceae bacterium]
MRRPRRAGRAATGLLAALLLGSGWREARGEDLTGYVEAVVSDVSTTNTFSGLPVLQSDTRSVGERVNVTWTRALWPRLFLWTGGTFDRGDVSLSGDVLGRESTVTELRPFFGLRRTGPRQNAQVLWTRDQRRTESDPFVPTEVTHDSLFAAYNWTPVRGPRTRATYTHDTSQDNLGTTDLASDLADLSLVQDFGQDRFRASYRGTYTAQDDAIVRTEAKTVAHRGALQYDDVFAAQRIWLHSEYVVARRDTTLSSEGVGELVEPVFAVAGLSARDATPLDGPLTPLPSLVDDDTLTATGIDLGLPGPGDDTTPWSLGVDLGDVLGFDSLDVYVDRTIERPSVISAFTWRLYLSDDNLTWTPSQVLTATRFDGFQRRFELRLAPVSTRFAKLVVAPLTPGVPFATEFPDLFVTELRVGRRLTVPGATIDTADTTQTLQADARARLLSHRDLFYEGSFRGTESTGQAARWRASNGLSYVQPFAEVWTVSARAAYEQEHRATVDRTGLVYASSLAVSPVPRLRWTASFSGRQERIDNGLTSEQNSVFLYGTAGLYDGVDVQLGVGRSYLTDTFGRTTVADQIDVSATIVPRPELTFGLLYSDTSSSRVSGDVLGFFDLFTRAAEVNAAWTPFPTTYLYGSYRLEWRTDLDRDQVTNVVLSWAPFPLGDFRMSFSYNQIQRTLLDSDERSYGPSLRWDLNRRSYLQLSYRSLLDASFSQRLEDEVATATLHWGF